MRRGGRSQRVDIPIHKPVLPSSVRQWTLRIGNRLDGRCIA